MNANINQNEVTRFAEEVFACLATIQTHIKASLSVNRQQPALVLPTFTTDNTAKSNGG